MNEEVDSTKERNHGSRVKTYERPDPPIHQRHPVIIIVIASISLVAILFLTFFII